MAAMVDGKFIPECLRRRERRGRGFRENWRESEGLLKENRKRRVYQMH
jgi:hypothetical protein